MKIFKFNGSPLKDEKEFAELLKENGIHITQARLIPLRATKEEPALTSIFLSSLRLVNEFRKMISEEINLVSSGKIYVFTEINFSESKTKHKIPDGLICIVKSGKIVDSALVEMKSSSNLLDKSQIEDYLKIADVHSISKVITVSNQFVANTKQTPTGITRRSDAIIGLYHLSWKFIETIMKILLTDNDTNISDPDQIEIMNEVYKYFTNKESGVSGFTLLKDGWAEATAKIVQDASLTLKDTDLINTVETWLQEEKDIALILSRKLGVLVKTGRSRSKDDLGTMVDREVRSLKDTKCLESVFKITNAPSDLDVKLDFKSRTVVFSTTLKAPANKEDDTKDGITFHKQVTWIKDQINQMKKKESEAYKDIANYLEIQVKFKNAKGYETKKPEAIDSLIEENKGKYIKEYSFYYSLNLAKGEKFTQKKKFIEAVEKEIKIFYQVVIPNIQKWKKPIPKIVAN